MPISIGTNIASLKAQRELAKGTAALSKTLERLSSGLRINRASDDPAGLAVSSSLYADARVFTQAQRNLDDGISVLNIADGALQNVSSILERLSELAEQAANGSYSSKQRSALQLEVTALTNEYNRVLGSTKFNGQSVFQSQGELRLQVGYGANGSLGVAIGNSISRATGSGTLAARATYSSVGFPEGEVLADFNQDGILDIAVAGDVSADVKVLLGVGDGTFMAATAYAMGASARSVKAGDLNNDGRLDLVTADTTSNSISVRLGQAGGSFGALTTFSVGAGTSPTDLSIADFNEDGALDAVVHDAGNGTFSILRGNGSGGFGAPTSFATGATDLGNSGDSIEAVDINADGHLDVLTADYDDDTVSIRFGDGKGSFSARTTIVMGGTVGLDGPVSVAAADLNGDGASDVITSNRVEHAINIRLGNGDGTFQALTQYSTGALPGVGVSILDNNGDGFQDIVALASNFLLLLNGNGDGTFAARATATVGNGSYAVAAGDLNGDGASDFVTTDSSDGAISVVMQGVARTLNIPYMSVATQSSARSTLTVISAARDRLNLERGGIGAFLSRLEIAHSNIQATIENSRAAASRIVDADIAQESSELVRREILQQASTAILAQANQQPSIVLKLLDDS